MSRLHFPYTKLKSKFGIYLRSHTENNASKFLGTLIHGFKSLQQQTRRLETRPIGEAKQDILCEYLAVRKKLHQRLSGYLEDLLRKADPVAADVETTIKTYIALTQPVQADDFSFAKPKGPALGWRSIVLLLTGLLATEVQAKRHEVALLSYDFNNDICPAGGAFMTAMPFADSSPAGLNTLIKHTRRIKRVYVDGKIPKGKAYIIGYAEYFNKKFSKEAALEDRAQFIEAFRALNWGQQQQIVKVLAEKGVNINALNYLLLNGLLDPTRIGYGDTKSKSKYDLLNLAIGFKNIRLVTLLLERQDVRKIIDRRLYRPIDSVNEKYTALHLALKTGQHEILKLLLQHGANPNLYFSCVLADEIVNGYTEGDEKSYNMMVTPLFASLLGKDQNLMKTLLDHSRVQLNFSQVNFKSLNKKKGLEQNILYCAIAALRFGTAKEMLAAGANIHKRLACIKGLNLVEYFFLTTADEDKKVRAFMEEINATPPSPSQLMMNPRLLVEIHRVAISTDSDILTRVKVKQLFSFTDHINKVFTENLAEASKFIKAYPSFAWLEKRVIAYTLLDAADKSMAALDYLLKSNLLDPLALGVSAEDVHGLYDIDLVSLAIQSAKIPLLDRFLEIPKVRTSLSAPLISERIWQTIHLAPKEKRDLLISRLKPFIGENLQKKEDHRESSWGNQLGVFEYLNFAILALASARHGWALRKELSWNSSVPLLILAVYLSITHASELEANLLEPPRSTFTGMNVLFLTLGTAAIFLPEIISRCMPRLTRINPAIAHLNEIKEQEAMAKIRLKETQEREKEAKAARGLAYAQKFNESKPRLAMTVTIIPELQEVKSWLVEHLLIATDTKSEKKDANSDDTITFKIKTKKMLRVNIMEKVSEKTKNSLFGNEPSEAFIVCKFKKANSNIITEHCTTEKELAKIIKSNFKVDLAYRNGFITLEKPTTPINLDHDAIIKRFSYIQRMIKKWHYKHFNKSIIVTGGPKRTGRHSSDFNENKIKSNASESKVSGCKVPFRKQQNHVVQSELGGSQNIAGGASIEVGNSNVRHKHFIERAKLIRSRARVSTKDSAIAKLEKKLSSLGRAVLENTLRFNQSYSSEAKANVSIVNVLVLARLANAYKVICLFSQYIKIQTGDTSGLIDSIEHLINNAGCEYLQGLANAIMHNNLSHLMQKSIDNRRTELNSLACIFTQKRLIGKALRVAPINEGQASTLEKSCTELNISPLQAYPLKGHSPVFFIQPRTTEYSRLQNQEVTVQTLTTQAHEWIKYIHTAAKLKKDTRQDAQSFSAIHLGILITKRDISIYDNKQTALKNKARQWNKNLDRAFKKLPQELKKVLEYAKHLRHIFRAYSRDINKQELKTLITLIKKYEASLDLPQSLVPGL